MNQAKAFILAAGLGSRLGELTKETPKCLIEVGGKPLLKHVLDRFLAVGVNDFIVNTFYLAEKVESFLSSLPSEYKITISREPELLGTGGAIQFASHLLNNSDFFVHNADILSEIDLKQLQASHQESKSLGTLAVMRRETSRYLCFNKENHLCGWKNKDGSSEGVTENAELLAFSGVQILSPKILRFFENTPSPFSTISSFLDAAKAGQKISSFLCDDAYWCDIGTVATLETARARYA